MESERAARVFELCFDGRLHWLKGHTPDHSTQYQPTGERCTSVSCVILLQPDIFRARALGNITQVESSGNSSYNALWVTATRRLTSNLQFDASYTWSKSLDYNSFSTGGIVAQNSYDLAGSRGLSDFDARHRFVD